MLFKHKKLMKNNVSFFKTNSFQRFIPQVVLLSICNLLTRAPWLGESKQFSAITNIERERQIKLTKC